jgi:hypothetical protein
MTQICVFPIFHPENAKKLLKIGHHLVEISGFHGSGYEDSLPECYAVKTGISSPTF